MGASEQVIEDGTRLQNYVWKFRRHCFSCFLITVYFVVRVMPPSPCSLWIASLLNIVLDPLLIYGIGYWAGFGLKGAAIATCIGRGLGVLYQCNILSGEVASSGLTSHFFTR
ncbi:MAG: hypothetical protein IPN29_06005 [Saprospiraceae bacterium]|nr:hypothetical protein [Saprospiraceae bacterium]